VNGTKQFPAKAQRRKEVRQGFLVWTRRKTLLTSFSIALITISCAQNQKVATDTNTNETVVSSTPPFQTKEPERYQATRTITTITATGETTVTKNLVARDGELRRDEIEMMQQRVVLLYLPEGNFLFIPGEKVFVDLTKTNGAETSGIYDESESSPDRLLHTDPIATSYRQIATETVNGRAAQKYRVVVNSSTAANVSVNETLIWIDEALHMPIRSETTSGDGKRVTMELSDIKLDVDRSVFQIPEGYEKITILDLSKRLKVSE